MNMRLLRFLRPPSTQRSLANASLRAGWLIGLCVLSSCGPKAAVQVTPVAAPAALFEQKMRWILQLEDQRQLRGGGGDLIALLGDPEARVRRRSALAIGRVRLPAGVSALTSVMQSDADAEVRQMAAFALGLIGDNAAGPALVTALSDPDALIQGRAAEALGLIGNKAAAPAITQMVFTHVSAGALTGIDPDDMAYPKAPAVEAVRLGAYAMVRLGSYDSLASAFLDQGRIRSRWWPIAFAFQRVNDPRAAPVLLELFDGQGQLTRAFAARGLGVLKEQRAAAPLVAAIDDAGQPLAVRIQAVRAIAQLKDDRAGAAMRKLIVSPKVDQNLQLEAITALAQLRDPAAIDLLIDLVSASGRPFAPPH